MEDGSCDGCTFAIPNIYEDGNLRLVCRRFSPQLFVLDDELTQSFPDAEKRCGEYKENEEVRFPRPQQLRPTREYGSEEPIILPQREENSHDR